MMNDDGDIQIQPLVLALLWPLLPHRATTLLPFSQRSFYFPVTFAVFSNIVVIKSLLVGRRLREKWKKI